MFFCIFFLLKAFYYDTVMTGWPLFWKSWKSWKSRGIYFGLEKVMEFLIFTKKSWKSHGTFYNTDLYIFCVDSFYEV